MKETIYAIVTDEGIVDYEEELRYVRLNPETNAYIECTKDRAEAIAVNGTKYTLPWMEPIEGVATAVVTPKAIGNIIYKAESTADTNKRDISKNMSDVENTICELDSNNDERMLAIENAICDIEMILSTESE